MSRQARFVWFSVLIVAAIGLTAASMAWACSGPNYGTPATPTPPPVPSASDAAAPAATPVPTASAAPSSSASASSATAAASATASGTVSGAASTVSGSTSGAVWRATGASRHSAPGRGLTPTGAREPAPQNGTANSSPETSGVTDSVPVSSGSASGVYGTGAITVREAGGTAGVTRAGGQSVFKSSVAPRAGHRGSTPSHATVPSARSATGDAWSGVAAPAQASPVAAASSYAGGGGSGMNSTVLAGILILGVGMTALFGGALAVGMRRRKASARGIDSER